MCSTKPGWLSSATRTLCTFLFLGAAMSAAAGGLAIDVQGLWRAYGSGKTRVNVLKGLNLSLAPGGACVLSVP